MSSHSDKYLTKLLFGFAAIIGCVFVIIFACFERTKKDEWYGWGLVASVLLCTGIYLLMEAFVHRVKADFIRRQKSKEQQRTKTVTPD
jgi:uncharacterized membrane protein HdeD (DUF308 family)